MSVSQLLLRPNSDFLGIAKARDIPITTFDRKLKSKIPEKYGIEETKDVLKNSRFSGKRRILGDKMLAAVSLDYKFEERQKDNFCHKRQSSPEIKLASEVEKVNSSSTISNPEDGFTKTSDLDPISPSLRVLESDFRYVSYHAKPQFSLPPQPIGDLGNEIGQKRPLINLQAFQNKKAYKKVKNSPVLPQKICLEIPRSSQANQNSFDLSQSSNHPKLKGNNIPTSFSAFCHLNSTPVIESSSILENNLKNLKSPTISRNATLKRNYEKSQNLYSKKALNALKGCHKLEKHDPVLPVSNSSGKEKGFTGKEREDNFVIAPQTSLKNSSLENLFNSLSNIQLDIPRSFLPMQQKSSRDGSFSPIMAPLSRKVKGSFQIAEFGGPKGNHKKTEWELWEENQLKKNRTKTLTQLAQLKMKQLNEYKPTN